MPSQSYAIEKGGLKRLTITWKYSFKDVTITFDGQPIDQAKPYDRALAGIGIVHADQQLPGRHACCCWGWGYCSARAAGRGRAGGRSEQ